MNYTRKKLFSGNKETRNTSGLFGIRGAVSMRVCCAASARSPSSWRFILHCVCSLAALYLQTNLITYLLVTSRHSFHLLDAWMASWCTWWQFVDHLLHWSKKQGELIKAPAWAIAHRYCNAKWQVVPPQNTVLISQASVVTIGGGNTKGLSYFSRLNPCAPKQDRSLWISVSGNAVGCCSGMSAFCTSFPGALSNALLHDCFSWFGWLGL